MIDIYYRDLREWAVDNWQWVEQAIDNGITDTSDFHKMIQAGQYSSISSIEISSLTST